MHKKCLMYISDCGLNTLKSGWDTSLQFNFCINSVALGVSKQNCEPMKGRFCPFLIQMQTFLIKTSNYFITTTTNTDKKHIQ